MRFSVFLALFLLVSGVEAVSIESVIYDLELNNDGVEGFCLIKGTDAGEIEFSSSWEVVVLDDLKEDSLFQECQALFELE